MNDKVTGIVLSTRDYKDNDLLIQVLTKKYGFLSFIAKGAKKISAKNHFNIMNVYEFLFDYQENKTLFIVKTSKLISAYYDEQNTKLNALKNILLQVSEKTKEIKDEKTFDNLIFVLSRINDDNKYLLSSLFFSYILMKHGIKPNVDECVICKDKNVSTISKTHGGFLCKKHSLSIDPESVETLKKFRLIVKAASDFNNYELIKNTKFELYDFKLLVEFFITNSEIKLSSYELYLDII